MIEKLNFSNPKVRAYCCFIAILFAINSQLNAQDIHFSQYYAAPLQLNPALTGINDCNYRLVANFRSQWSSITETKTYRTFAASYDMNMGKNTAYSNFGGFGLSFYADQAGEANFNTNKVDLHFAYHFMLDRHGKNAISVGAQGGIMHRSIDQTKLTFDSQFDPDVGFDPNGPRETLVDDNLLFGDASAGIFWSMYPTDLSNIHMGVAVHHVNQPNQSFFNDENEKLYMKLTLHGGGTIPFSDQLSLMPTFLVMKQGPSHQVNVGTNVKFKTGTVASSNSTAISAGIHYRVLDALIAVARVDIKGVKLGVSYDINLSKLSPATASNGGPEVSLIYTGCFNKKKIPVYCPNPL